MPNGGNSSPDNLQPACKPTVFRASVGSSDDLIQVSVEVHQQLNQHGWCFVEFRAAADNRPGAENWLGQSITVEAIDPMMPDPVVIFEGIVWQCEVHCLVNQGYNVVVIGVTKSWQLDITYDQNAFTDMTLSAIAAQLTEADSVSASVSLSGDAPWPYIVQWGQTDMAFLAQRAYERNAWIRPTATGIEIRDSFDQGATVEWASDLIHYAVVGRIGPRGASGTYYDPEKTISDSLSDSSNPNFLTSDAMTAAVISASGQMPSSKVYRDSHDTDEQDFQNRLKREAERDKSNVFFTGVSRSPFVAIGNLLSLDGLLNSDGGTCGVIKVIHTWTGRQGYRNEFIGTLASQWVSAEAPESYPPEPVWETPARLGLRPLNHSKGKGSPDSEGGAPEDPRISLRGASALQSVIPATRGHSHYGEYQPTLGVVSARVTDNNDPDHLGRLKVQYIWSEDSTPWIRMATPNAGADRGFVFQPEIGDEVLVAFEDGDANSPLIIGSLWNSANNNAQPRSPFKSQDGVKNNDLKRITTKAGHRITLCDTAGEQGMTFVTPFGCSIKMLEKHTGTGRAMLAIENPTGDIFLGAPAGRVHIYSKFHSKEVGGEG
jgi:hypothetical protein